MVTVLITTHLSVLELGKISKYCDNTSSNNSDIQVIEQPDYEHDIHETNILPTISSRQ